jgi:flagellar protein FlaG
MLAMEIGSHIPKNPALTASNGPPRAENLVPSGAVKTDLAPEAAVQAVKESEAVRFDLSSGIASRAALDQALRETIARRIEIEPKTREIVHQTVNEETGEVLRQVPDEALLRLRVYSRELREKSEGDHRRVEKIA